MPKRRLLPDPVAAKVMQTAGVDRLAALYAAIDIVRRGGTISITGVCRGMTDPLPILTIFDKQLRLCMGQTNVKRWVDDILLTDSDPLGVDEFATHRLPLGQAPRGVRHQLAPVLWIREWLQGRTAM